MELLRFKGHCAGEKTSPLQNKYTSVPHVVGAGYSGPHNKYIQIWQRSYYDRIIRSDAELQSILGSVHQ